MNGGILEMERILFLMQNTNITKEQTNLSGEMKIHVLNLTLVLILDGYILEIGAHVRSILYHLTCLRHSNRSRAVTNRIVLLQKDIFSFMRSQHVLIYQQYKYHESDCMSKNLYLGRLGP